MPKWISAAGPPLRPARAEDRSRSGEHLGTLHSSSRGDDARHARHSHVRADGVSPPPGERPPERGLPHDHRVGRVAGRKPADDGGRRRDAAREAVLDDRRARRHDVLEHVGRHQHHAAIHALARHRCRRPGRAGGHFQDAAAAAPGHSAAVLQQVESGGLADPLPRADVQHTAASRARRVRRNVPRAATLDGQRRRASAGIQVDPKALAALGIGLDEVTAAASAGNPSLPTGTLWGPQRAYTVLADGSISSAPEFRKLAVTYQNGAPVRLQDVAQVLDDVQDSRNASWYDGKRAVILAIQRQPGTNTVQVADGVKATVASLAPLLPASVEGNTLYHRSVSIRQSVDDVQVTLFVALILVVLVIFLFLKNLSATVIPRIALPFSIIGTFSVMYLMGYSLDNLSLMALTLSVGFVVDDAIVMLENIVRHLEKGKRPMQAALDGAREIGFTILSMTLSLTAVFIPVLLMGGIIGRLFHEFAVTIGVAILVSGFVSLTLTPMLCSRFLRPPKEERHGRWYEATER